MSDTEKTEEETTLSPPMRDSDVVFIITKRLDVVAKKMQRHEYDEDLARLMEEAAEWFGWLAGFVSGRCDGAEPTE